ncbi:LytTR family DNA-binding domain-containing protein [Marinicella meishanensis]|uniref:LytTR family DNA-binding domain-containing protein n=1 Tax=Marinicella meishanensis TaxID=2873263 RepID=UPI001CBB55B0|nr:LytTR family DNA-binding domain-containing protein [Marinicella sp. NBU2979]
MALAAPLNDTGMVRACLVDGQQVVAEEMPDFSADPCYDQALARLDPQHQLLWVAIDVTLDPQTLASQAPLGVFISGKASAQVWLNGQFLGRNGEPAMTAEAEQPGLIDAVIHLPSDRLQPTNNQLQLLLSAHHGWLTLAHPIHGITISPYRPPTDGILRHYWPSLLPFGVLVLGFFYLTLVTWLKRLPQQVWLLPLMALMAAAQLFIEVYRGLSAYPYHWQDVRLLLILACSLAFGWSLLAYVLKGLPLTRRWLHGALSAAVVLLVIAAVPGFDSKSVLAILLSVLLAMAYLLWARFSQGRRLGWLSLLLVLFVVVIFLNAYSFIDTVYYYFVAGLIFMLMAQQAKQASQDQQLQLKYQARAQQLQQIIEQKTLQDSTEKIEIRSAGKTEWLRVKDLAYCKGAGDYVELVDTQGSVKLFHGSLTELSLRLPTTFLKTHRSYLVNTTLISALERSPSGAGQLCLTQGAKVPVSKRIMPQVREQLS